MKSIKLKNIVKLAGSASHTCLAHPAVKPGQRGVVRIIEITGIPDEVSDEQVCLAWDHTADATYLGNNAEYPRHTYRYEEIGEGRILRA
jgi:hypothetical protein